MLVLVTNTERKRFRSPSQPVGRWIRVAKRLAIYLRDGFRCLCCDRDLHGAAPEDITLDHIVPRSQGGTNHESNIYTCCRSCNSSRSDRKLVAFVGAGGMKRIRRHSARKLARYVVLAKGILTGSIESDDALLESRGE